MTTKLHARQLWVLALLTLVWGLNWPVMKLGVSGSAALPGGYPPLTFRVVSMLLGLPVLGAALVWLKVPLTLPRAHWPEVVRLALPNMIVWHVVIILAIQSLSSGRSAILGYTMPVFSALWGVALFGERMSLRQVAGVAAAALGVVLLLWSEFAGFSGAPLAALALLVAAAIWALGTHMLRRSTFPLALLTLVFWMTALTTAVMAVLAFAFERHLWRWPEPHVAWAIAYNAVGVFGFAHAAWFYLARNLPPVASTISVMLIPVLGVFSGALWLGEQLHWQDFAAMASIVVAIGAVLWRR
ncbi:MAG: DMT family transporter [Rubrivivax sp.]|nr:DMT family transporter [Rubrivivax sp.]